MKSKTGLYCGTIDANECVTTEAKSGNLQICVGFNVTHVAGPGQEWVPLTPHEPHGVFLSLADGAMPYTRKKLDALGFNGDFGNPLFSNVEPVVLECREETWQGKTREKWELHGEWGRELEPASTDRITLMNARYKATGGGASPAAPAAPPAVLPATVPAHPTPQAAMPATAPMPAAPAAIADPQPASISTKEQAWQFWCDKTEGTPKPDEFTAAIAEVTKLNLGIAPESFEPIHWQHVASMVEIPF